jgi:hypothetical protein
MGRRSRKRRAAERSAAPSAVAERPRPATPRARGGHNPRSSRHLDEGPPKPPWDPFPLAELSIFVSLVLVIVGFIVWGRRGQILVGAGAIVGSLATLEFTIREHVGGYRSHTTLLAGFVAVCAGLVAFFLRAPQILVLVLAALVFAAMFALLRGVFKRTSGGLGWRGGLK